MAVDTSTANGGSLAAMLEQQHARDESRKPTVEETVDEENIKHAPPPSSQPIQPILVDADTPEQPTTAGIAKPATKPAPKKAPVFDVQSEELFPALGSGPKPAAPAAATWGAKKPSASTTISNGLPTKSMGMWKIRAVYRSRITNSTPTEVPRVMAIPGKHMEQLRLAPSQMQPRGQLKKPLRDIVRDISRRSKANVEMRGGPGASIIFEGKGHVDAVRQALREVAQQVGSKVYLSRVPNEILALTYWPSNSNQSESPFPHPLARTSLAARVPLSRTSKAALVPVCRSPALLAIPALWTRTRTTRLTF